MTFNAKEKISNYFVMQANIGISQYCLTNLSCLAHKHLLPYLNTKHLRDMAASKQAERAIKCPTLAFIFVHYSILQQILSSQVHVTHRTSNGTHKHVQMEAEAENKIFLLSHTDSHINSIIKRVGGMPWEPTGVCL